MKIMKGRLPRTKYPKLRAWAKPARKVMTMVIPTKKDKLKTREGRKKHAREEIEKALKNEQ